MSRSPRDGGSRVLPPTLGTRSGMGLAPRGASVLHQLRMWPGEGVMAKGHPPACSLQLLGDELLLVEVPEPLLFHQAALALQGVLVLAHGVGHPHADLRLRPPQHRLHRLLVLQLGVGGKGGVRLLAGQAAPQEGGQERGDFCAPGLEPAGQSWAGWGAPPVYPPAAS